MTYARKSLVSLNDTPCYHPKPLRNVSGVPAIHGGRPLRSPCLVVEASTSTRVEPLARIPALRAIRTSMCIRLLSSKDLPAAGHHVGPIPVPGCQQGARR
jgi:hypothetical protein